MTPSAYWEVAHWVALHVERQRVGWRGRRKLQRMLRRLREKMPDITISYDTIKKY